MSDAKRRGSGTALDELVAASRAGAEQVEEGRFRLDWERALDKVKRFQLADPHRYVLELLPAAVAGGATKIEITTDSDDLYFRFDGQPYSDQELTRLFDYLFSQDVQLVRIKQLALAVNSALGLQPKWIVVESGDGEVGRRMRLSTHKDLRVEELSGADVPTGTLIHVRERVSWKVMGDLFRSENAEDRLLAENCVHAPIPMFLNGVDLRRPLGVPALARREFERGAIRGEVVLPLEALGTSSLDVCMGGLRIVEVTDQAGDLVGPVAVRGWVDNPALTRNASHSDVHRDDQFDACFSAVRMAVAELMKQWVGATLLGSSPTPEQKPEVRAFSDLEMRYLRGAAQLLLRADRKVRLSPSLDALLDVPGVVELAVKRPKLSSLRPLWEGYRKRGSWHVASQRYDLSLQDLPADLVPALGPLSLLDAVFPRGRKNADGALTEIARGVHNRRHRERNRQDGRLSPTDVVVTLPVADAKRAIRGELGLLRNQSGPCMSSLAWLVSFGKLGAHLAPHERGVHTVFLRDGVYLGERVVAAPVRHAVAMVDSPGFAATGDWNDLAPNDVSAAVESVLTAAVPALLEELSRTVRELPPPGRLLQLGYWSAETGEVDTRPIEMELEWPSDRLAQEVRWHVDAILEEHDKLDRKAAPWLWDWPLFFSLDGRAMSLADLEAVEQQVYYAVEQPWGHGAPAGALVLNVSSQQLNALQRYRPGVRNGKKSLLSWRETAFAEAAMARRRRQNLALAESRRQPPRLAEGSYAAVAELALAEGVGQIGIPLALVGTSWVRYLFEELPLPDEAIETPVPVHVLVSTPLARADDAFEKQIAPEARKAVEDAVQAAMAGLVAAFASSTSATGPAGRALVWSYLGSLKGVKKSKKNPLAALPDEIVSFPLVPTVDRGAVSLRQIFEDAIQHRRRSLVTDLAVDRQLTERPILVCGEDKRKILRRVLAIDAQEYTRELEQELAVLDRMARRQPALLDEATALSVKFDESGMVGELGIRASLDARRAPGAEHWVYVLRDGVPLERVSLTVDGIPFIAVVDCPRFRPTSRWDSVVRDEVWKEALEVLRRASEQLILQACHEVVGASQLRPADPAIVRALRSMAGQRFRGRPWLCSETDPEVEKQLSRAAIWDNAAIDGGPLSLRQISEARSTSGTVWVVGPEFGHVAPGRVVAQAHDDETRAALASIFGGGIRDGRDVLRRDEEAYQRRLQAPVLDTSLDTSRARAPQWIEIADAELGVEVRGEVALRRDYRDAAPGKLDLRLAIDGRFLCNRTVPHALRGFGHLDCKGLEPNRDWNGVASDKQLAFVNRVASRALWDSVEEFVRRELLAPPGSGAHEHEQTLLVEALRWLVVKPEKRPELRERLMSAPLFRSVRGDGLSANQLVKLAADAGDRLLVVNDALGPGEPADGRLVIRASAESLHVLEQLLGRAVRRHDEEWKAELEGQRRRRELPESLPALACDTVVEVFFQDGDTYGVAGLVPPLPEGRFDETSDPASVLRIHVGRRKVTERQVMWHPAVEVWINDDRLRTTAAFDDILPGENLTQALHLAAAQIPELMVRAAETCQRTVDEPLRLRICNYVLTRIELLLERAGEQPAGAEARLLDAQIWRCLAGAGNRTRSTRQLLAAHEAGQLRTAPEAARGRPASAEVVVVRASELELGWLGEALGVIEDYSGQLERDESLRVFLARPPVAAVTLSATGELGTLLHRRALSGPDWEGEIGVRDDSGRTLMVAIYWQRRWMASREIPAPVSAVAAVQCDSLLVTSQYNDVVVDQAYKGFVNRLFGELWLALAEMAGSLGLPALEHRASIQRVCVRALAAHRAEVDPVALPSAVEAALREAPLLVDVRGQPWSIDRIEKTLGPGEPVAAISPDTARLGEPPDDRPVLVIEVGAWEEFAAVLALERFDAQFVEILEGRQRREGAETSFRLSRRRTLVPAKVTGPGFSGRIGLGLAPEPGWLVLFSGGRRVEKRAFPGYTGLVGSLDGELATDRTFQCANLSPEQERSIRGHYEQRLTAAVTAASAFSGSRRSREWKALCLYTQLHLGRGIGALGGGLEERRKRLIHRDPALPDALLEAAALPVFRAGDGGWVDFATAIGGDAPELVIARERVDDLADQDVRLLVGDPDLLRPLFCAVLGARAVHEHEAWVERRKAAAEKRAETERKRAEARRKRLFASVKSMIRDALDRYPARDLRRADASRLRLEDLGREELTLPGGKSGRLIQVSSDHEVWQAALAATETISETDQHLAAAILADLTRWQEPRLTVDELCALLACIARR